MQRRILLFLLVIVCSSAYAQKGRKGGSLGKQKTTQQDKFLKKQWWLGFKAGTNLSSADPVKRYTILTPTNYAPELVNKKYTSFKSFGSQAGIEISFQYNNFIFSTQPMYRQSLFAYSNQFTWTNTENTNQTLVQHYDQEQKVSYADIPLIVKYTFESGRLRPYLQVGIYYSYLINATQTVTVSGIDNASGSANPFSNEPVIVGAKDLFDNYWSLGVGAGVTYQLGNVQLELDAAYRKGMSNITNVKNRFSNDRLSGIGDVQDDVKLNNIVISFGVLFPMRFLNSNYKSLQR